MRLTVLLFFPLLGAFDFLRMQNQPVIGYLVIMLPLGIAITYWLLLKPMLRSQSAWGLSAEKYRLSRPQRLHAALFITYIAVMLAGFLHAISVGSRNVMVGVAEIIFVFSIVLFFYVVVQEFSRKGKSDRLISYVGISLLILILGNLLAAGLGHTNSGQQANYLREFTNIFGVAGNNLMFPFTGSGRMLSIQAGILIIFGIFHLKKSTLMFHKWIGIGMVVSGLIVLFIQGGRIPIVMLVGTLAFVLLWRISRSFLVFSLMGVIVFPLLVVFGDLGGFIQSLGGDVIETAFSVNFGDVGSFSNRDKIFSVVLIGFFAKADLMTKIFGFGAQGQVASGMSDTYSTVFSNSYADPFNMPTHNTIVQILVDYGVLGLIIFLVVFFSLFSLIRRNGRLTKIYRPVGNHEKLLTTVLLYMLACSMTEVSITYYSYGIWSIFIFINIFTVFGCQNRIWYRKKLEARGNRPT